MRCRRKKRLLILSVVFYIFTLALLIYSSTGYFPNIFVKYASNPVFAANSESPSVLRYNSTHLIMYYDDGTDIRVRTSADGLAWSSSQIVLNNASYPYVWHNGSHYRMLYNPSGGPVLQEIRLATSTTGVGFVDQGQLVAVGVGTWDATYVFEACEIEVGSIHYLYYTGRNSVPDITTSKIGLATSNTGNPGSYAKQGIALDSFGRENGLYSPEVHLAEGNQYVMIYSALAPDTNYASIYLAKNYSDMANWSRLKARFIFYSQPSWETTALMNPTLIIENGFYRVWYDNNALRIGYAWALFEATETAYTNYESNPDGNVLWNGQVGLRPNSNHTYYHKFTGRYENITLSAGTLGLGKGTNAFSIRCTTIDCINVRLNQWFQGDGHKTQYQCVATTGVDVTVEINSGVAGEPQGVIGDISWSYDEASTTITVLSASGSTVTLVFQSAGTQVLVWYLDRIPMWLGIAGMICLVLSPITLVYFAKENDYQMAFIAMLSLFIVGIGLLVGWLW